MVSDLQMNDHTIVRLADATVPADGMNKRTLDTAVKIAEIRKRAADTSN